MAFLWQMSPKLLLRAWHLQGLVEETTAEKKGPNQDGSGWGWWVVEVPLKLEGTSVSCLGFGFYLGIISPPLLS